MKIRDSCLISIIGAVGLGWGVMRPLNGLIYPHPALGSLKITPQSELKNFKLPKLPRLERGGTPPQSSFQKLSDRARSITVKIFADETWGSGIIIERQGRAYTVVTNAHVLRDGQKNYRLQTADGTIHQSQRVEKMAFPHCDLALLQFSSPQKPYEVAALGSSSTLREGDKVVAAGFPFTQDQPRDLGFKLTDGQVSLISKKSLEDGYQIGYTNKVEKGMSGGPVLNLQGDAIAINGMHAYPLWGEPYVYQDGEIPPPALREKMKRLSWAIPIDTFLKLAPQFDRRDRRKTFSPI